MLVTQKMLLSPAAIRAIGYATWRMANMRRSTVTILDLLWGLYCQHLDFGAITTRDVTGYETFVDLLEREGKIAPNYNDTPGYASIEVCSPTMLSKEAQRILELSSDIARVRSSVAVGPIELLISVDRFVCEQTHGISDNERLYFEPLFRKAARYMRDSGCPSIGGLEYWQCKASMPQIVASPVESLEVERRVPYNRYVDIGLEAVRRRIMSLRFRRKYVLGSDYIRYWSSLSGAQESDGNIEVDRKRSDVGRASFKYNAVAASSTNNEFHKMYRGLYFDDMMYCGTSWALDVASKCARKCFEGSWIALGIVKLFPECSVYLAKKSDLGETADIVERELTHRGIDMKISIDRFRLWPKQYVGNVFLRPSLK